MANEFHFVINKLGNEAFADNRNVEIARLLHRTADALLFDHTSTGVLRDHNGNVVGSFDFQE